MLNWANGWARPGNDNVHLHPYTDLFLLLDTFTTMWSSLNYTSEYFNLMTSSMCMKPEKANKQILSSQLSIRKRGFPMDSDICRQISGLMDTFLNFGFASCLLRPGNTVLTMELSLKLSWSAIWHTHEAAFKASSIEESKPDTYTPFTLQTSNVPF